MKSKVARVIHLGLLAGLVLGLIVPAANGTSQASAASAGAGVSDRSTVVDSATGRMYIVYGNVLHLVSTPQVLTVLGIAASSAVKLDSTQLAQLQEGAPLTLRETNGQTDPLSPVASGTASLTLSTASVPAGEPFSVQGAGFTPSEPVQLVFDFGQVSSTLHADATGVFSGTFVMPVSVTPAIIRVFAFGGLSKIMEIEPIAVLEKEGPPHLTASAAKLYPGDGVGVAGTGFQPYETVSIYFTAGGTSVETAADVRGAFTAQTVTAPATISPGSHSITASGKTSHHSTKVYVTIVARPIVKASLVVSPAETRAGQPIVLSGAGFLANELVHVRIGAAQAFDLRADGNGAFQNVRVSLSQSLAAGKATVSATGTSSQRSSIATLSIVAPLQTNAIPADGSLIRDQSTGRVYFIWGSVRHWIDSPAVLQTLGFSSASPVDLPSAAVTAIKNGATLGLTLVDGLVFPLAPVSNSGASLRLSEPSDTPGKVFTITGSRFAHFEAVQIVFAGAAQVVATDGSGNLTASLVVPGSAQPNSVLQVIVLGQASHVFAMEPFNVINAPATASLISQTPSVLQGAHAIVSGSGFLPNEQVNLFLGQTASAAPAQADQNGIFSSGALVVPPSLSVGSHSLMAYGLSSKRFAQGTITIVKPSLSPPTLSTDRTSVNPGSLVQVRGYNFAAHETVHVSFGSTLVLSLQSGSSGQFGPVGITIPTTTPAGSYTLSGTGGTSNSTATVTLTIVAYNPSISISPVYAIPGTRIAVGGNGYAAGEIVTLALNGQALATSPGQIKTGPAGAFSASFIVPPTALAGANTVAASGATSRASATMGLAVSLPVQSTWYFAGGNTAPGFDTEIALVNPNGAPTNVTFSFMFTSGSPMPYSMVVGADSRATVNVGSIVGAGRAVFTMLTADRKIGASETVFRNGQDFSSTSGASAPLRTWYLAEGYTGLSFHEYIRIFNPGIGQAHVDLRLLPFNGRPATSLIELLAAQTGTIVDVNAIESGLSLSAIVSSDQPVVVERLMTFGPGGYGATEQVGASAPSSTWLFAEGSTVNNFETYYTILNPSSSQLAAVTATFFDQAGNVLANTTVLINPLRRGNIKVNDLLRSSGIATILTSNIPVVAERPLYFGSPNSSTAGSGGSDVFGRNGGGVSWLFPEGNTSAGYTEFLLLQNPSARPAPVTVRFFETNGQTVDYGVTLPGKSRTTVDVLRNVPTLPPGLHGSIVQSTNGVPIIAEQSIYSDNFTKGDGEAGISQ